jgi:GTP-binding protein
MPVHVLLTKSDKLSRSAGQSALQAWRRGMEADTEVTVQLFSATAKDGLEVAREQVLTWLDFRQKKAPV